MNKLKAETRNVKSKLSKQMSYMLTPKSNISPRMYGLPKIHKEGIPLRPIIDFTGSPTYDWARHLASILKPLMGQTTTHIHSAPIFCDENKRFTIDDTEVMVSYDVVSLYTKVRIQQALEVIQQGLLLIDNDTEPTQRTQLSPSELSEVHSVNVQRKTVWADRRTSHGFTIISCCGQHFYGKL